MIEWWAWTPVLQGRTVDDYLRHAVDLADIIYELAAVYNRRGIPFRVGVGSICRRAQVDEVRRIVAAVSGRIMRRGSAGADGPSSGKTCCPRRISTTTRGL